MSNSEPDDQEHSIVTMTVLVVILAIVIITVLTVTAIVNGPPGL